MSVASLYEANEWLVGLVFLGLVLAASEAGFHLGRSAKTRTSEGTKSQIGRIQGDTLGVLALLLGFTMTMAVSRFETRKHLVLEESNAIGTAYLRTQLVPNPEGTEMAGRLREYVGARLEYARAGMDPGRLQVARAHAGRLQDELWARAVAFSQKDPRSVTAGLLLQALNQVIDLDAARFVAAANRVPETVILVVALITVFGVVLVGYLYGLGDRRHHFSTAVLAVAFTVVLLVIVDLDRPGRGFIQVSQQPMIDLQDHLAAR